MMIRHLPLSAMDLRNINTYIFCYYLEATSKGSSTFLRAEHPKYHARESYHRVGR